MTSPFSITQSFNPVSNQKTTPASSMLSIGLSSTARDYSDTRNPEGFKQVPVTQSSIGTRNPSGFKQVPITQSSIGTRNPEGFKQVPMTQSSIGTMKNMAQKNICGESASSHNSLLYQNETIKVQSTRLPVTVNDIHSAPMSIPYGSSISTRNQGDGLHLLEDNMGELDIVDTRKYMPRTTNSQDDVILEDIPTKISGAYNEDYNIIYVDEIIRKKLRQEKFTHLQGLKLRYKTLESLSMKPQTYVMREKTLESMKKISDEISQIETGEKLRIYDSRVKDIISEYRKYNGKVKTVIFDVEEEEKYEELDDYLRDRIFLIDTYLDIASEYIQIDVIRVNNRPSDICTGCGISLAKVATSEEGTLRCPNPDCQTEHNVIILAKLSKDGSRINTNNNTDDESIDNFLRAFTRYQGLQPDLPDKSLYDELDSYFARHDLPSCEEIKLLPLNSIGRRGDTDHKMLWTALSQIGRSEYYEDANLIGHLYWGWTLPNVMHLKERIIEKYNKTQKVFYQIPPEERGRNSSLGTQYRLWRHLQLEGHECYMDEFKIAENPESIRTHNKLWRLMCEGSNDPDIHYIP